MGIPGCPELAFCTASIARPRIVSAASRRTRASSVPARDDVGDRSVVIVGSSLFSDNLDRLLLPHRLQPAESGDGTGERDGSVFAVSAQQVIGDKQLREG